jgi:hypothetical protein
MRFQFLGILTQDFVGNTQVVVKLGLVGKQSNGFLDALHRLLARIELRLLTQLGQ